MNLNIDAIKSQSFDAIVVGSGVSGGYAAKELTEKGVVLPCSESLIFFMQNKITLDRFDFETLDLFSQLDDFDIISALK